MKQTNASGAQPFKTLIPGSKFRKNGTEFIKVSARQAFKLSNGVAVPGGKQTFNESDVVWLVR